MRTFWRGLLLFCGFMLILILPLILLGSSFEEEVTRWLQAELSTAERFWLLAGILATDIFLPIPSSAVSTYGGGILGTLLATIASWLGMNAGAILGFALARRFGKPFAARLAGEQEVTQLSEFCNRHGPVALVLLRGLPILAEASVLLVGTTRLSWEAVSGAGADQQSLDLTRVRRLRRILRRAKCSTDGSGDLRCTAIVSCPDRPALVSQPE